MNQANRKVLLGVDKQDVTLAIIILCGITPFQQPASKKTVGKITDDEEREEKEEKDRKAVRKKRETKDEVKDSEGKDDSTSDDDR